VTYFFLKKRPLAFNLRVFPVKRNLTALITCDYGWQEWKRTGFTWEQYDPISGEGRRSKPFTGWTSLVTMIMAEEYDM
jgi:hypothetical protein